MRVLNTHTKRRIWVRLNYRHTLCWTGQVTYRLHMACKPSWNRGKTVVCNLSSCRCSSFRSTCRIETRQRSDWWHVATLLVNQIFAIMLSRCIRSRNCSKWWSTWCRSQLLSFSTCYLGMSGLEGLHVYMQSTYWLEPPIKGQKVCSQSAFYWELPLYWQLIGIPRPISSSCFYKDICPSPNQYPNLLQLPILHLLLISFCFKHVCSVSVCVIKLLPQDSTLTHTH